MMIALVVYLVVAVLVLCVGLFQAGAAAVFDGGIDLTVFLVVLSIVAAVLWPAGLVLLAIGYVVNWTRGPRV